MKQFMTSFVLIAAGILVVSASAQSNGPGTKDRPVRVFLTAKDGFIGNCIDTSKFLLSA
jgi:hypothetical protein